MGRYIYFEWWNEDEGGDGCMLTKDFKPIVPNTFCRPHTYQHPIFEFNDYAELEEKMIEHHSEDFMYGAEEADSAFTVKCLLADRKMHGIEEAQRIWKWLQELLEDMA